MSDSRISIVLGNIVTIPADAIVNAANSSLLGGGGVDGAIHRAGGPAILEACKAIVARQGGCPPGEAVITTAGKMPARFVIHTVGPVWKGGSQGEAELLASCYRNALSLAIEHDCRSISFPAISTGVYGYPQQKAAAVALETIMAFLGSDEQLEKVILVCFQQSSYDILQALV